MIESKKKEYPPNATPLGPGAFPIGSLKSRAAARLRLHGTGDTGKGSAACTCFPEDEQLFFCTDTEEQIAANVKCPLHGDRFKQPICRVYVSKWRREREPLRRQRLSPQYQKAWADSFLPDSTQNEGDLAEGSIQPNMQTANCRVREPGSVTS